MADYVLDTNIVRYWYDTNYNEHRNVVAHVDVVRQPDPVTGYISRLFVSVVTLAEIEYGHRVAANPDPASQMQYSKFVRDQFPEVIEIARHVAKDYGELRASLFQRLSPRNKRTKAKRAEELVHPTTGRELSIDENDLWIAAQAVTHNLVLVTHDSLANVKSALEQVAPALEVQDWTLESDSE